jgi:aspartate-semialdehyde dehydrogenase
MHAADTLSDELMSGLSDRALLRSFAYVGGRWNAARSGGTIEVTDPATGETVGHVARLSGAESAAAVDAADTAFPA